MTEQRHTLYGVEGSYYAAKVRSYLIQKHIPYTEVLADRKAFDEVILPRIGYPIVPIVITPENIALQDTALIIEHLEANYPDPPIIAEDINGNFLCHLLELYADEWLKIPGLHYRWWYDADFAALMMGKNNDPTASEQEQRRVGQKISQTFRVWPQHLGATAHSKNAVEQLFLQYLDLLEAHFREHSYILGQQASLADCALMGPLYAHGFHDPHSGAIMRERTPNICTWIERMRTEPERNRPVANKTVISEHIIRLVEVITQDYAPMIVTAVETAQQYLTTNGLLNSTSTLPRYLGEQQFRLGIGETFEVAEKRSVHSVEIWKFQRLLRVFADYSSSERTTIFSLFDSAALRNMLKVNIPFQIQHQNFQFHLA